MGLIEGATRCVVLRLNGCLWELTQVQIKIGSAKNAVCWCLAIHVASWDVTRCVHVCDKNKQTHTETGVNSLWQTVILNFIYWNARSREWVDFILSVGLGEHKNKAKIYLISLKVYAAAHGNVQLQGCTNTEFVWGLKWVLWRGA